MPGGTPRRLLIAAGSLSLAGVILWLLGVGGSPGAPGVLALLASSVLAAVAMALYPGAPPHASGRGRTMVDALLVAGSALLIAWVLGLDDLYRAAGGDRALCVAVGLAAIAVAAGTAVMATRARPDARVGMSLAATGFSLIAAAACGWTYLCLDGGAGWVAALYAGWPFGWALVALAATRATAPGGEELEPGLPGRASVFIPSVPFAAAVVAAALAAVWDEFGDFLTWTGAVLVVLVVMRQILALVENISFWRRLEATIRARTDEVERSEAHFRTLVEHSSDVIAVVDADGTIQSLGPSLERVLGYRPEEIGEKLPLDVLHDHDFLRVTALARELSAEPGGSRVLECRVRRADGEWRDVEAHARNLLDHPAVEAFVVNLRDITERKRGQELSHLAYHDPLTDLANRSLFGERLQEALDRADENGSMLAILFLDLDDFKSINDSLGHGVGDFLLTSIAERLLEAVGVRGMVARLGGDEFGVLLEDSTPAEAGDLAARVLEALDPPVSVRGRDVFVRGSIGIALSSATVSSVDELLRNADVAMYEAKQRGSRRHEFFEPSMHAEVVQRLQLEDDLRSAVEREEFALHFQPVVSLETGAVLAVEALVRWEHPRRGMLGPGEFIPAAERTGFIDAIGRWVLRTTCAQGRDWADRFEVSAPLPVIVNLSAAQLHAPSLVGDVGAALEASGLEPSSLILEITESVAVEGQEMMDRLDELRAMGVRLGIDDFGSEHSSLSYLRRLPVEIVKVDREFMQGVAPGSPSTAILKAIAEMSESIGLIPIAEGVETAEQADELRGAGYRLAQGNHFAKPMTAEEMDAALLDVSASERQRGQAWSR